MQPGCFHCGAGGACIACAGTQDGAGVEGLGLVQIYYRYCDDYYSLVRVLQLVLTFKIHAYGGPGVEGRMQRFRI